MTRLNAVPALSALSDDAHRWLTRHVRYARFPPGGTLRPTGTPSTDIVLLLSGTAVAWHVTRAGRTM